MWHKCEMRPTHYQRRTELGLTERQREVLGLISRGKTNPEIAGALGISLDGAKAHVSAVLDKLKVHSREEAATLWKDSRGSPFERIRGALSWPILGTVAGGAAAVAVAAGVFVALAPWFGDETSLSGPSIPNPEAPRSALVSYRLTDATVEGAYRDEQAWRVATVRTPGSEPEVVVYSNGVRSAVSPAERLYWTESVGGRELGEDPLHRLLPDNYIWPSASGAAMPSAEYFATQCSVSGSEVIASRDALRLYCGSYPEEFEIWLDVSLGWVLKVRGPDAAEAERSGEAAPPSRTVDLFEVTRLELDPAFASDEFVFVPPVGYLDGATAVPDPSSQIALRRGDAAGGWSGTTLSSAPFSFAAGESPTVVLLTADWCDAACDLYQEFGAAAGKWSGKVRFLVVFVESAPERVQAVLPAAGARGYEVVLTAQGTPWAVGAVPMAVAIDASGKVVELFLGRGVAGNIDLAADLAAR